MSANGSLMLRAVERMPQGVPPHTPWQAMAAASPAAPVASVSAAVASGLAELTAAGVVYAATEPYQLHPRYLSAGLIKCWM